jgi:hypothetical protein
MSTKWNTLQYIRFNIPKHCPCTTVYLELGVGLGTEFRSEKIPRNRLGTVSECSFRGIPSSAEEPTPKLGTEQNGTEFCKKLSFTELAQPLEPLHSDYLYILLWVVFSSAEWFGTEFREFASIFVPRNGIPSCFLFRWRVRKRILRLWFYFCSTERNSELFSLPRKCSERNSESFLFRGTDGIPSEITICSVYSVFRGIIFLSEIPNTN